MKRFLVAGIVAIGLIAGNASAGDIQKLYLEGSSSEFNVGKYKGEADSIRNWEVEGRAKVEVAKGIGFDSSILYPAGSSFKESIIKTGVFYQPTTWSEVSYSTSFDADRFNDFGDVSVVKVSVGKGF